MDRKELISKVAKVLKKDDSVAVNYILELDKEDARKKKIKMERLLHVTVGKILKGVHRDEYWKPIKDLQKELGKLSLETILEKSEYYHKPPYDHTSPDGKRWVFQIPFNENGGWKLSVDASFGPSKVDPKNQKEHLSDAYDLTYSMYWDKNLKKEEQEKAS